MKRLTGSKWAQGTWGGGREWGWAVAIFLAKALHSGAKPTHPHLQRELAHSELDDGEGYPELLHRGVQHLVAHQCSCLGAAARSSWLCHTRQRILPIPLVTPDHPGGPPVGQDRSSSCSQYIRDKLGSPSGAEPFGAECRAPWRVTCRKSAEYTPGLAAVYARPPIRTTEGGPDAALPTLQGAARPEHRLVGLRPWYVVAGNQHNVGCPSPYSLWAP